MKPITVIGNWKSNKTRAEVSEWFNSFASLVHQQQLPSYIRVILALPFVHLPLAQHLIQDLSLPITLAAQNCSAYDQGAYTGEIAAAMLKDYVSYCLIGHSERRLLFHETDDILAEKVRNSAHIGLRVIFCVPDAETAIPKGVSLVAYEPVWAIGSGKAASPTDAQLIAEKIRERVNLPVVYGGSVNAENIDAFIQMPDITGVLPGGASLNSATFHTLIQAIHEI